MPRHVLGRGFQAPSDTVNIAIVGIGGMGGSNARALMSQNIVAICDVDDSLRRQAPRRTTRRRSIRRRAAASADGGSADAPKRTRRARPPPTSAGRPQTRWRTCSGSWISSCRRSSATSDYRQMLDKQKDLDGIVVATPDHMHAIIASSAMDIGKHVYVQKPLCWSVQEARHLAQKAKSTKVVTQMGNQGHSRDEARLGYEYITAGAIGEIREVHVWTNRPLGYWPQGVPRPAPLPDAPLKWDGKGVETRLAAALGRRLPAAEGAVVGPVPRRRAARSTTTRSITRSTGAAGWTGARARSATWART